MLQIKRLVRCGVPLEIYGASAYKDRATRARSVRAVLMPVQRRVRGVGGSTPLHSTPIVAPTRACLGSNGAAGAGLRRPPQGTERHHMARSKQAVAPSASPFAGGIDHVHEIKSRQEAAARACNAYGEGWAQIAETLVENYPYIETLRSDAIEMQRAAAVGGITLKRRTVAKPAHLILGIIYPEKVRQRISEWAAPLDIAHKHRWTGEQLKTALLATPLKKFKKTYDPASSKPTPEPAAINDTDESDSGGAVDDLSLDDALAALA